ncbi:MAG: family 16 glycosylhydrolase [Clostridia bacterium]|nr:family 16 glycosylhydrolase [Clostridia bacterium]
MKRILSLLMCAVLIFICGCSDNTPVKVPVKVEGKAQYVIALNPSVMLQDGTVYSLRNGIASAMQNDVGKDTTSLYDSTAWRWIYKENSEEYDWYQRKIRNLSLWVDGKGETTTGAPYAYKFSDDGLNSLGVFDSTKMDVKGFKNANMNQSGVLLSFTGDKEEGLCYTAAEDCLIEFIDRDAGTVALVDSIVGLSSAFAQDSQDGIVLRIYKNNRIYWQEVISANKTDVVFPTFTAIELEAGDSMMITAQATKEYDSLALGNCDLPAEYKTVTLKKPVTNIVPVEIPKEKITSIPLVKDSMSNFTIVYPKNITEEEKAHLNSLTAYLETNLSIYPEVLSDSEVKIDENSYYLLIGKTKLSESQKAIKEIANGRKNNAADFIIRQQNNKIVIAAENRYSLGYAIEFFKNNYCKDKKSAVEVGLNYVSSKYNSAKDIKLAGVSISDYTIVYSAYGSFMEVSAADYLFDNVIRLTGKIMKVTDDKSPKANNEILIGHTNRSSSNYSVTVSTELNEKYTIKVKNGQTSVLSVSNSAVNAGVIDLVARLKKGSVKAGTYTGEYDGSYSLTNGYKLAWSEDFNGDKLSKTWKLKGADGYATCHGGTTYSTMNNASVGDGVYKAKVELIGNDSYGVDIQAAGANSMYFKYGFVEGRIKMSDIQGYLSGLWVCTYTTGDTGEFDIYENAGETNSFKPNLHLHGAEHKQLVQNNANVQGGVAPKVTIDEKFGENYHNFGMEWTDDYIAFYIDGKRYYTFDCTLSDEYDVFDQYSTVVYSAFSDRGYTNLPVPDDHKVSYNYVDWIRVWQKDEPGYGINIK